jgi:hypothetical protein
VVSVRLCTLTITMARLLLLTQHEEVPLLT